MSLRIFILCLYLSTSTFANTPQNFPTQDELDSYTYNQTEELKFERVIDGDTFVASGKKIRLWGIDSPERDDPFYDFSSFALKHFVRNYVLECKFIEKDVYQRFVMQCFANGEDLASMMVKFGFAKDYKKYSGGFYKQEQKFAREQSLGIWKPKE